MTRVAERSARWAIGPFAMELSSPRWVSSLAMAAAVTFLVCWPAWPGFMSYDSLFAYEQGREDILTMLWPPAHAYMFRISDRLNGGPGEVFVAQTFILFASAALILHMLLRRAWCAKAAFLGFALTFLYFPPQLGVLLALWRDVPTASLGLLTLALWLLAVRRRSYGLLVAAAAALGMAVALRYNAFILVLPLLALMVWAPFGAAPESLRPRLAMAAAAFAAVVLAGASTHWRLPDLLALPRPDNFGGTQEFDLIGISACADRNFLPAVVTQGQAMTPYQIRRVYDPRHLLLNTKPHPGQPQILESDGAGEVKKVWPRLVREEFGCYLAHRTLVFTEQMGMAEEGVFYPVHGAIDTNRFGLKLERPEAAHQLVAYVQRHAAEGWRRPAIMYLAAFLAVVLALVFRGPHRVLLFTLLAGAFGYAALLFVAAPAADARYIFPSNVLCCLIVATVGGHLWTLLMDRWAARRGREGAR